MVILGRRGRGGEQGGFSLLEVMVALAVLALALVTLSGITTANVRNTHHAKMVTVATFLARAKMADLEDLVLEDGFTDNDIEEEGDFGDQERPEFRWKTSIIKIELPVDMAQQAQDSAQEATEADSDNPLSAMAGFMGGFMSTLIEPIRVGLEESVRRVSVTVFWNEAGRPDQSFTVDTFMTDPAKLDMAVQAIGQPPGGAETQGGTGGTSGSASGSRSPGAAGSGAAGSRGR